MSRVQILAVGRMSKGEEAALVARYQKRHKRFKVQTVELAESNKSREAEQLLGKISDNHFCITLDERGQALDSVAFAQLLGKQFDAGRQVSIVIGGPDGLDPSVNQRADRTLNLGQMTWPHQLVRVLLAEQLYRAETILLGHPYHRV